MTEYRHYFYNTIRLPKLNEKGFDDDLFDKSSRLLKKDGSFGLAKKKGPKFEKPEYNTFALT